MRASRQQTVDEFSPAAPWELVRHSVEGSMLWLWDRFLLHPVSSKSSLARSTSALSKRGCWCTFQLLWVTGESWAPDGNQRDGSYPKGHDMLLTQKYCPEQAPSTSLGILNSGSNLSMVLLETRIFWILLSEIILTMRPMRNVKSDFARDFFDCIGHDQMCIKLFLYAWIMTIGWRPTRNWKSSTH